MTEKTRDMVKSIEEAATSLSDKINSEVTKFDDGVTPFQEMKNSIRILIAESIDKMFDAGFAAGVTEGVVDDEDEDEYEVEFMDTDYDDVKEGDA